MTLRFLLRSLLVCTCFFAAPLHAQTPALTVSSCPDIDADELERLLAIEFATLGSQVAPVREISVLCRNGRVEVLARTNQEQSLRAEWSLEQGDRASITRLLALRISELLATPPPSPAPPAPALAPSTSPPALPRAPRHEARFAASAGAVARRQGTPKTWLFGAALAGLVPLHRHLTLRADLTFEAAQAETPYADVAWRHWTTSVSALWYLRMTHLLLGVGPGLRGGWVSLQAHDVSPSREARRLSAPWAGPLVLGHLEFRGSRPWRAVLDLEGGLTALAVHGLLDGEQEVLSVDGIFVSAQLGVGYGW